MMEEGGEKSGGKPAEEIRARFGNAYVPIRLRVYPPVLQGGFAPVDPQKGAQEARWKMTQDAPTKARRGTETRKKNYLVTSRYDADEYAELDEAASRAGLTRASYQRVQSLDKPKTRSTRRAPIEREILARTLGQLGKIGSNLNQIARDTHVERADLAELDEALASLRALVPEVLRALGRDP
jgi:Bacterial mobilisation protein (MobC)